MGKDETIADEVQESDFNRDARVKTSASQNQFYELQSMVDMMQSEISKLVSILQESIIPTKIMHSTEPNATAS